MCLALLAHRVDPRHPLLLLGNRDEFHARPSAAAAPWPEDPRIVGGRDLQAGGAWLGLHADGRFALVTNRRGPQAKPAPRSRGVLVRDYLLGDTDAADFAARAAREHAAYGPFNLLLGDAMGNAFGVDGVSGHAFALEPGLHVISNGPWHARWPKTERLRAGAAARLAAADDDDALLDLLADSTQPPDAALPDTGVGLARERLLAPIFIRGAQYGTRASSLVRVRDDGACDLRERHYGRDGTPQGEARWRRDPGAPRWAPD
ncbi:MAG: NRDE family protein [Xanthomonadaceae bacterium]|nr:NRDE family protein [Xanthomonadaceae bacterium]